MNRDKSIHIIINFYGDIGHVSIQLIWASSDIVILLLYYYSTNACKETLIYILNEIDKNSNTLSFRIA